MVTSVYSVKGPFPSLQRFIAIKLRMRQLSEMVSQKCD